MSKATRHRHPTDASTVDPVCGMTVAADGLIRAEHDGEVYGFCSEGCRARFVADPERYTGGHAGHEHPAPSAAPGDTALYTCPMHPEIRRPGPGACPICGMALEPLVVTADSGPNPELADMTHRLWFGAALAVPVVLVGMGRELIGWVAPSCRPRRPPGSSWSWLPPW